MDEVMPNKEHFKFVALLLPILGSDRLGLRQELLRGRQSCLGSVRWLDTQTLSFESWEMHSSGTHSKYIR